MTVYLVVFLPKLPHIHRVNIWFWPTLYICTAYDRIFGDLPARITMIRRSTASYMGTSQSSIRRQIKKIWASQSFDFKMPILGCSLLPPRLDWIGLDWVGLGWIGLEWIGLDWIGLDWIGLDEILDWIPAKIHFLLSIWSFCITQTGRPKKVQTPSWMKVITRVGQNHIYTVYIRYFGQRYH